MSQELTPVEGGRKTIKVSPLTAPGVYISEQYQKVKKIQARDTEWANGRPVYDRLPSASQRYRVDFGQNEDLAYVYLPVGESLSGPNSLGVSTSGGNKFLVVKSGTITWKYGEIKLDPVVIDVKGIGFGNSRYLLAYSLFLDDSPYESLYEVTDYNLRGYPMAVSSNTDSVPGWRYKPQYAFYGEAPFEWRNYDSFFNSYSSEARLSWEFPNPATLSQIKLRCSQSAVVQGSATLSSSTPGSLPKQLSITSVQSDSEGQFFSFDISDPMPANSWSIVWSDPKVSISNITVTGTISVKKKPAEALSRVSMVAYPRTNLPATALDSNGNEVPLVYCKLAYVDIDDSFTVTAISDLRESVNVSHQPIADWLTRPWDNNLSNIQSQINNYASQWMAPDSSLKHEYVAFADKFSVEYQK
jgi:hypothetical protein